MVAFYNHVFDNMPTEMCLAVRLIIEQKNFRQQTANKIINPLPSKETMKEFRRHGGKIVEFRDVLNVFRSGFSEC